MANGARERIFSATAAAAAARRDVSFSKHDSYYIHVSHLFFITCYISGKKSVRGML